MKRKFLHSTILALALAIIPSVVFAHDGKNLPYGSFIGGLIHPVLGYDHLLAMLSVGILSAQIGGRAIWTVPATFVGVMGLGGALGLIDVGLTSIEAGIAASLIVLGLIIAADRRLRTLVMMAGVGFFAIFHGYAHGAEMPTVAEPVKYALGFMTGTALIHIAGVVVGHTAMQYQKGPLVLRVGGGLISIIGVLFIAGIL